MKTAKGSTRRVFIFKNIVVKVPRIRWVNVFKTLVYLSITRNVLIIKRVGIRKIFPYLNERKVNNEKEYEEYRIKQEQLMEMECPRAKRYEYWWTMANCLMGGVMANYQEWKFWRKTKNVFVMPTYFSFFGLLNIQKRGQKITFWNGFDVWDYIHQNSQNHHQPFCDGHTLSEIDNFCLDNGRLKMVDYGSRRVEPFLKLNGEKIYNNFKIPD